MRGQKPAMSTSTVPGHAAPACPVVREGARAGKEREVDWVNAISGELKEAYHCAGGCQGRGAVKSMLEHQVVQTVARAGRGAHRRGH
jgi:hypothetical protein